MKAKLPPRLTGLLLLGASGGTTLLHRTQYEAAQYGPPQLAELGLGLATFMLASTGVLMLIHGSNLFERKHDRHRCRTKRSKLDALYGANDGQSSRRDPSVTSRAATVMQARRIVTAAHCAAKHSRESSAAPKPNIVDCHPVR